MASSPDPIEDAVVHARDRHPAIRPGEELEDSDLHADTVLLQGAPRLHRAGQTGLAGGQARIE